MQILLKNVSFIFIPCLYYKTQHVSVCICIPNKAFKKSAFCMIASVTAYYRGINTPNFTVESQLPVEYPSYHEARGEVHPGNVTNLSQCKHTETDNHSYLQLWL